MTISDLFAVALLVAKALLALVSICFLVSGFDDFFVDVYHAIRAVYRRLFVTRCAQPLSTARLLEQPEQTIAVMIPAWDESAVIRRMLEANLGRIRYGTLHVFVGTYPNDPATNRQVELVRVSYPNVHRVVCPHDGPTNKADCLNRVYEGIRLFEEERGFRFEILALNDSEDVIHPLCFKLFNYLIPRLDMVQVPVIPLEVPWWHFTAGHYLDEFAENHAKDMVVRESLTGAIPGAGVGCAFSRRALELACAANDNQLFSTESLAEDYDLGLRLGQFGLKQAFVRVALPPAGQAAPDSRRGSRREFVAIGEYFPSAFRAAVRQKARWIVGISFQGWRRLGWRGGLRTKYALLRDRKGLITNPTVALGYCVVLTVVMIWTLQRWNPDFYKFPAIVEHGSWLWYVILVNTFFLCLRLVQRCRFVWQVRGWRQALLAVPRQVWANIVNIAAVSRAFHVFGRSLVTGRSVAWDKTRHTFPAGETLADGPLRLGGRFPEQQLQAASPLNVVEDEIVQALAEQARLPFRFVDPYSIPPNVLRSFPRAIAIRHSMFPLEDDGRCLVAAGVRPLDREVRVQLEDSLSRRLRICLAPESDVAFALRRGYQRLTARRRLPPLGEQLVASGLLTENDLREALRRQRRSYVRLGTLLAELEMVSPQVLDDTVKSFQSDRVRLGEVLVVSGTLTRKQLDDALTLQHARFRRLGQVLVDGGLVSADALKAQLEKRRAWAREQAVRKQRGRPYQVAALVMAFVAIGTLNLRAQSSLGGRIDEARSWVGKEIRRFRVYPHLDRAYHFIDNHRLADAKRELESCLAVEGDHVEIWSTYFDVLYQLKEYDSLVARFERLHELRGDARLRKYHLLAQLQLQDPDEVLADLRILAGSNGPALSGELRKIVLRYIELASERQRPDLVAALLSTLPDSAQSAGIVYEAGNALRGLGSLDDASAAYERVVHATDAGNLQFEAYKALASLAIEQHSYGPAGEYLARAQALRPGDLSILRSLGDLAVAREDWNESIRWYRLWVNVARFASPEERYHAFMIIGRSHFQLAQYDQAAKTFTLALRARRNDGEALLAAARALQQTGQLAEALDHLRSALNVAPSGNLNAQIGLLLVQVGQPADALPYLERAGALGVSENLAPTLFGQLGYTYAALNQPEAAREAFTKALPQSSNQAPIHAAIGYASVALKDFPSAVDHFERSLALHDDPQIRRELALAYARAGDNVAVARLTEQLSEAPNDATVLDADFWNQLADLAFQSGRFHEAATLFRRASARAADQQGWRPLARAAESLERASVLSEAAGLWDELAHSDAAPGDLRVDAAERAGYMHLRLADPDCAVSSFLLAIRLGSDSWRLRLDLSLTLAKLGRWREALDESLDSLDRYDSARGHIGAALCFKTLNKPGMAIYQFARSLERAVELEPSEQKYVFDELTALYANEANYEEARKAATRSLAVSDEPVMALHLARMLRHLGRNEEARLALRRIDAASLPGPLRLEVLEERARVSADLADRQGAVEALQEAIRLEPSDARSYQLGLYLRDSGDLEQAMASLRTSLEAAPNNPRYSEALGYVYLHAGKLQEAVKLLTAVAQQEPDNLQVQQDVADAFMRLGDESSAVRWLRRAIDRAQSIHRPTDGDLDQPQDVLRMRQRVARIERRYETAGYFGYHALAAPNGAIDRATPLLLSQGGLELTRFLTSAQRGWSLIGRVMSIGEGLFDKSGMGGTLNQLAVGMRYKPFRTENLNFSAERLFQLGGALPNSWLLRALYSKENGETVPPDERWHSYSLMYGDVAGFVGPYRSLLIYGEARYGVSRSLNRSWTVRPQFAAVARRDVVGNGGAAVQMGAGMGITRYLDATADGGHVSSVEVRVLGSTALAGALQTAGAGGVQGLTLVTTVRF